MMTTLKRNIEILTATIAVCILMASCDIATEHEICDYNIQLRYDYNQENTTSQNMIARYVKAIDEYIFDEQGVLYLQHRLQPNACVDGWLSKQTLPPGKYSVIAIGNRSDINVINDARIGITNREDMLMTLDDPNLTASNDRLYYGYRTFSVMPEGISRVRVDMVHSHLVLDYRITWKAGPPAGLTDLNVRLEDVPSEYKLMPEFIHPRVARCEVHNPAIHDKYPSRDESVLHFIPTVYGDRNIVSHSRNIQIMGTTAMGQAITYRLRNDGQTMLTIYNGSTRIANPIPINEFLVSVGENLDQTLKQEYPITIEIDENGRVTVYFAEIADWDEGGWI